MDARTRSLKNILRMSTCIRAAFLITTAVILMELLIAEKFSKQQKAMNYKPDQLVKPANFATINQGKERTRDYKNRKANVSSSAEKTHIAFLKVHKAASSTVQNILFRFGYHRNLSFLLPYHGHYISRGPNFKNRLLSSFDNKTGKYDIICNHAFFNLSRFRTFMYDDAFYIAIVREPLSRFISAAYYYKFVYSKSYLSLLNSSTMLHDLITSPKRFEPKDLKKSYTFNQMAFEFGLGVQRVADVLKLDKVKMNDFVTGVLKHFDFVMIVEYLDESLVMLKRYLGWSIKDILYIRRNELNTTIKSKIQFPTDTEKDIFKRHNHLDYLLYNRSLKTFLEQRSNEKKLVAEVRDFKRILELVEVFCISDNTRSETVFRRTKFNNGFKLSKDDCKLMILNELHFVKQMVGKHRLYLQHHLISF